MSRQGNSAALSASQQSVTNHLLAVSIDFPDAPVRAHTGVGELAIHNEIYTGVGQFGGISSIEEASDNEATRLGLSLSGIPGELISTALNTHYQGRKCSLYLVYLDEAFLLIGEPILLYQGLIDTQVINKGAQSSIKLSVQSRMSEWRRPVALRLNNETQQNRYPGDKGFEFVERTVNQELEWDR